MPPLKKKGKSCNDNSQLCTSIDDDRLSSLPDNLLLTILSLIPFSSAVATSVLSQRWRHLWTYLTHVSLNFSGSDDDSLHNFQSTITTINHVISKLSSPQIKTFHLHLPSHEDVEEQVCSNLLVPTIHEICLRNPVVIQIDVVQLDCSLCHLSTSLFKTHSLVELKLKTTFVFDFATDVEIVINLPNLKILDIDLCDSHRRLMHTLFKSCPLLEHLCLCLLLQEHDHLVNIIAPNLKSLTIKGHFSNYSLLIDAPMLVSLKTCGNGSVSYHFVKNLRYLQEAKINVPKYHVGNGNDYVSRILALFQGISCARSITFNRNFHDRLLNIALPSFLDLIVLSFVGFDLGSSSWMPSCLLIIVKSLEIRYMMPNDYGIRLLQNILSNATVLEQLQVFLDDFDTGLALKTRVWKEYKFAIKLFKLPKSSSSCQIELSGDIFTASCEGFKNDELVCKLRDLNFLLQ